jgi:hypothetical protein
LHAGDLGSTSLPVTLEEVERKHIRAQVTGYLMK